MVATNSNHKYKWLMWRNLWNTTQGQEE
jgi:hypothetical protein